MMKSTTPQYLRSPLWAAVLLFLGLSILVPSCQSTADAGGYSTNATAVAPVAPAGKITLSLNLPSEPLLPGQEVVLTASITTPGAENAQVTWMVDGKVQETKGPSLTVKFSDSKWNYHWVEAAAQLDNSQGWAGGYVTVAPKDFSLRAPSARAKNVILVIGDGMGEAQRRAASLYTTGTNRSLAMDNLEVLGLSRTDNAQGKVTDSAAGGTALSTGVRTNNGYLGLDTNQKPLTTIAEEARAAGKSIGLVTNVSIAHATPASFAVHIVSRDQYEDIAAAMLEQDFQVFLGGGYKHLTKRTDGRDLWQEATARGFTTIRTAEEAQAVAALPAGQIPGRLLGAFAPDGMNRPYSPDLTTMAKAALKVLKTDADGYFLMIEAGQIDWAGHNNESLNNLKDVLEMDALVAWLKANELDGNTLLITTADHETGGLHAWDQGVGLRGEKPALATETGKVHLWWTSKDHTGRPVPITAAGPGAAALEGMMDNTRIHQVMKQVLLGK